MDSLLNIAVNAVENSEFSYCKYLSANDTKATRAHQSGYLISKSAWKMFLKEEPNKGQNIKLDIVIKWQEDFETESIFTYYGAAKNEFRITRFGRNFPFREEDNLGDLLVLIKINDNYFKAFILSRDEEIDDFFTQLNISPTDVNGIIPKQFQKTGEVRLLSCFTTFLNSLKVDFPSTYDLAATARNCYNTAFSITQSKIKANPDNEILKWLATEYQLFKLIESQRYSKRILKPFDTIEELIETANTILNRRKSRAGKSLEHHLSEIFKTFELAYESQKVTEDNKKPDFIFPSLNAYLNPKFESNKLITLASKTTCKDRWRQILNEADRVKIKHLFTLQQGISKKQLIEMKKYGVQLIVPKAYLDNFPNEFRNEILTLESFIAHVRNTQL